MKPIFSITLLTWLCLFGATHGVHAQSPGKQKHSAVKDKFVWYTDMTEAKAQASESNKKLFILFTGSDWCPPCIALKKNILDKSGFKSAAAEDYVFVMCDFPRVKTLSKKQEAHNDKLAKEYRVESFPTVVIAKESGKKIKSIRGFSGDSVKNYLKAL